MRESVFHLNKDQCCGCGACEAVCPVEAIGMKMDSDGFYYPGTTDKECVGCGLCLKVCIHQT